MKTLKLLLLLCVAALPGLIHAQYILTLHCDQMDSYIWKTFKVRVTEIGTGYEVGRKTISGIEASSFSIELYVLLQDKSYQVDFYVDENWNGRYDAPPGDPAWRRIVNNASGPVTINFTNDADYTDIGFPDNLPFGTYNAIWGGQWKNLTFGSTDTIEAAFNLRCDSVLASFSTKGVFGNPAPVMFDFADTVSSDLDLMTDTIHFSPGAPWTGDIYTINGEIHGSLTSVGFELAFNGTLGLKQLMCLYTVSAGGNVFANGYFYLRELEIIYLFAPLTLELTGMPISCHGSSDGSVWVAVDGGTGNYEYSWLETGSTTPHIEGVWADTFHLTVSDEFGCSIEASYILDDHYPLSIDAVYVIDESCPEACDAIIVVEASGGVNPYSYMVDGDGCPGIHMLYVTDAVGCTDSTLVLIGSSPILLIPDIYIIDATNGQSNGSVEVDAAGGTPPFLFSLDGITFQASSIFNNLPAGSYCITVMDANGCSTKSDTFLIENITGIHEISSDFNIYPNPSNGYVHISSDLPLSAELTDIRGQQIKFIPLIIDQNIVLEGIPAGMYILGLSDGHQTRYQKLIIH